MKGPMKQQRLTDPQIQEILDEVSRERATLSLEKACKKVGLSMSRYQYLRARMNKTHQVVVHGAAGLPTVVKAQPVKSKLKVQGKCILMIADVSSVAQLVREFT